MLFFCIISQTEAELFRREIFGSHHGAFIQHKSVPKHEDERQVAKKTIKPLFLFLSAVPHIANVDL